jgi:serine/threonine-protein kinase
MRSMADRGTNMPGTECGRPLTPDHRAERDRSSDRRGLAPEATGSWHCGSGGRDGLTPEPIGYVATASVADTSAFPTTAAIPSGSQPCSTSEVEPAVRFLPRALPLVSLMILAMAMGSLGRAWGNVAAPPILRFGFEAMILLVLAVGFAFGAWAISRPRPQAAEATHLGQYRIGQQIGAGAMGEVYLAEHRLLKRPCALKLIRRDRLRDPRALARFEREVRLTATLSHPNTVEIYDCGRASDGRYYYVMEYLPGLSLEALVERHGPMPPGRAVYLLRQLCQALREAHAVGLIHRDIKPSNIIAARRGGMDDVAKLLDFGLVRPAESPSPHLSGEGQILGTPLFMSPEQAAGDRELDRRSDLYSLGAVAYYLLTGRPPFDGGGGMAVLVAHARDPVVPPSLIRAGIPEDLEHVVLRCLEKDAADRFADAESLERALHDCACSGEWDQDRAARWWRDAGAAPAERGVSDER